MGKRHIFSFLLLLSLGLAAYGCGSGGSSSMEMQPSNTTMAQSSSATLVSATSGDNLGFSMADAGDVNGDGYNDLIAGAPAIGAGTGKAYIYYGRSDGYSSTPDITLTGEEADDSFGYSVSGAGDLNSDGKADVIVGAYLNTDATDQIPNSGAAYIFFGGPTMSSTNFVKLKGAGAFERFGFSVAGGKDVDGDTKPDMLVGAPANNDNGYLSGAVYLFRGPITQSKSADLKVPGATGETFGFKVALGDINKDGKAEMLATAPYYGTTPKSMGKVSAYAFDGSEARRVRGHAMYMMLGYSLTTADINGDGAEDIVVSARRSPLEGSTFEGKGGVFISAFSNQTTLKSPGIVKLGGSGARDWFGWSVANAGKHDNEGDAILIGAKWATVMDSSGMEKKASGGAYVFHADTFKNTTCTTTGFDANRADMKYTTGMLTSDQFGFSVAAVKRPGEMKDIIVGAPYHDSGTTYPNGNHGALFVNPSAGGMTGTGGGGGHNH